MTLDERDAERAEHWIHLVTKGGMTEAQATAEIDREIAVRAIQARNRRMGQADREIDDEEILDMLQAM
jgi:hypothetical protein